jgi:hypothetical protein
VLGFLKFLIYCALLAAFIWFGATVPLGKHTLFGHVQRIWKSDETQDLLEGTKQAVKPAAEKAKRVIEAGVDEAKRKP